MRKLFCVSIVAMALPLLSGCFGKGSSADPPTNFQAVAGDGRVMLTWDPVPDVDFWIFTATNPNVTAFNWTGLPNAHSYISASTPFYMCGLFSGAQYYFAANGRINGGSGGTSSPTITTTIPPYNASADTWTTASAPAIPDLYAVGYTGLTTCSNSTTSAAGMFAAVGQGGAIFTSSDGVNWAVPSAPPPGFTANLNAVTGHAANQNNPTNPSLRWVAVGDGGSAVYSTDGNNWTVATSTSTTNALHAITQASGTFIAVGNTGTIISSTNGNTWSSHTSTSGTTHNLNGVTRGTYYVAVGDSGTIVTSADGSTWGAHTLTPAVTSNLKQAACHGSIIVAVGDGGTIVTSKDNGSTWTSQILPATPNLVGIAAESQTVENAVADPKLGYISTAQFVAVDSSGNTYTSQNGFDWSGANSTGITTNALVSSGFGYVAVGNAGATAYAF